MDFYQYRVVVYTMPTHISDQTTCKSEFCIHFAFEFCKLKFQQPLLAFSMSHDHSEIIVYYYLIIGVFRYSRFSFNFVILVIVSCIMYTFMKTHGKTWKLMEIQKKKLNIQLKIANILNYIYTFYIKYSYTCNKMK